MNVNSNQAPPSKSSSTAPLRRIKSGLQGSEICLYGQISVIGRRRDMKDAVVVDLGFFKRGEESYDNFGVHDGSHDHHIDSEEEGVQTTAVLTLIGKNELVVAGFGGSKAVLSRGGTVLHLLDDDYKPDNGDINSESRSDQERVPVSFKASEPKVEVMRRSDADEFLIMGSNVLWDMISHELACQVARKCCHRCQTAATLMAKLAVARGSKENVSIVVVDLRV